MIYGKIIDLEKYNLPIESKAKLMQTLNDYYMFGTNNFQGGESFIRYLLDYFPAGFFHKNDIKSYKYEFVIDKDERQLIITLEELYQCCKKINNSIDLLTEKFQYYFGLDDKDKFKRYLNNFNNWESDDFRLFIARS